MFLGRVSISEDAGRVDPADRLPEPLRSEHLDAESRCCYRVTAEDEPTLRSACLASGMAPLLLRSLSP